MSLNIDPSQNVPVRPAATVMLIRDHRHRGVEVCMLRRNLKSDFVGGAYVFPGGGVDPVDGEPEVASLCSGRGDADASRALGLPRNGLAFWVAAVRETLEEAGLMIATRRDGTPLDFTDRQLAARFVEYRREVDHQQRRLVDVCRAEELMLSLGGMHYVGHWVTPPGAPRRYDTRFFLAAAPEGQRPVHDDREVISAEWITPDEALGRHEQGDFPMLPPTVANLRMLERYSTVESALGGAESLTEVPAMVPRILADDDGIRIVMPGHPDYERAYAGDSSLTAWPGVDEESAVGSDAGKPVGSAQIERSAIDASPRSGT